MDNKNILEVIAAKKEIAKAIYEKLDEIQQGIEHGKTVSDFARKVYDDHDRECYALGVWFDDENGTQLSVGTSEHTAGHISQKELTLLLCPSGAWV